MKRLFLAFALACAAACGYAQPALPTGLLAAWLPSGFSQSGGLLTGCTDSTGNGNNIVTVPAAPAVVSLMGQTWLNFAGSKYMTLPAGMTVSSQNGAVFAVAMNDVITGSGNLESMGGGLSVGIGLGNDVMPSGLLSRGLNTAATSYLNKLWSGFSWQLIGTANSASARTFYIDAERRTGTASTLSSEAGGYIGRSAFNNSNYWNTTAQAIFVFSSTPTVQQLSDLQNYCLYYFQCGRRAPYSVWAVDGDSITAGGVNGAISWAYFVGSTAVYGVDDGRPKIRNFATGGHTSAQVLAGIADPIAWLGDQTGFSSKGYAVMCGTNDFGTVPLATTEANVQAIVAAVKAAGISTTVMTVIPNDGASQANRDAYNIWLRAGNSGADHVVDTAVVPQLTNPLDTLYYSDGTHPTSLGGYYFAAAVFPVMGAKSTSTIYTQVATVGTLNLSP